MKALAIKNFEVKFTSESDNKQIFSFQYPAYPRAYLQRLHWQNIDGQWKFAYDNEGNCTQPGDLSQWTHHIEVPFARESIKTGIGNTGFHPNCWYEGEFDTPAGEGRLLLHFRAVDYRAWVWVNDQYMAEHEGGYTPLTIDITHVLNYIGTPKVTVWVQDDPHELAKPGSKIGS
jgi:beta-galactosidase/beta-glucuronidase